MSEVIDHTEQPYLSYLLGEWNFVLIMFVGAGVGLAMVVGLLKFKYDWRMKKLVILSLIPTIFLTCLLQWVVTDLESIIGLSWDCGAVTQQVKIYQAICNEYLTGNLC